MYEKLLLENFFSDECQEQLGIMERKIALSLISPNQVVHALPTLEEGISHLDLSLYIIADMYKVELPVYSGDIGWYRYALLNTLKKVIKNDESNFILIRYILIRTERIAVVEAPWYITEFERDALLELDEVFKDLGVNVDVLMHRYDPINMEVMNGTPEGFGHEDSDSSIKSAIAFYEHYKSIVNYELVAPKEYILK